MSQENVDERVRPYFEAASRRDVAAIVQWLFDVFERRDLAAAMAVALPEYEMHWRAELPDMAGAVFRGPEGVRELWRQLDENWDDFRLEPTEIIEEGEFAVVRYRQSARVRESDTRVEGHNFAVVKFRDDGQIVEIHVYADRREALEAAGLRE